MSSTAIFVIGAVVFAITVYGCVMAAGLALTQAELDENPNLRKKARERTEKKRTFFRVKY